MLDKDVSRRFEDECQRITNDYDGAFLQIQFEPSAKNTEWMARIIRSVPETHRNIWTGYGTSPRGALNNLETTLNEPWELDD